MAAQKQIRTTLNKLFSDGERPTGEDFASAWMSFLNQNDDNISYNKDTKNIELGPDTGLVLGKPPDLPVGVLGIPGTLRFNSNTGTVQFYDGANFKDIAGAGGAFVPVGAGPEVAFSGGNVGIGTAAAVPTHRLEIPLGANTLANQVLLGNLVVHNGTGSDAFIAHNALAFDNNGFALLQDNVGNTTINAADGGTLALCIGKTNVLTLTPFPLPAMPFLLSVEGILTIGTQAKPQKLNLFGDAFKTGPSLVWQSLPGSDARIKKDVKAYQEGLDKVIQLNPVTYKFNGKGGSFDDPRDYIGLIAQDVQKVAPEMVFSKLGKLNPEDKKEIELLNYDFHNVLFMFINAFKELNARVGKLEKAKK